jgi:hypothetical protein
MMAIEIDPIESIGLLNANAGHYLRFIIEPLFGICDAY